MSRVAAVVLNWNNWKDTLACVTSIQSQSIEVTILIVDNASGDDSVAQMRQRAPWVELLQSSSNLGFGGGCNIGILRALQLGAEYIWLLNSDATASPDALSKMLTLADSVPKTGAVGAVILQRGRERQVQAWGGGMVSLLTGKSHHAVKHGKIDFISGACVLYRSSALRQVGLFDATAYFMYWEDTDLSFRLRQSGWVLAVAPTAEVWHRESSSLGKGSPLLDEYFTRSGVRFFRRHAPRSWLPVMAMIASMTAKRLVSCQWARVRAVWRGVLSP